MARSDRRRARGTRFDIELDITREDWVGAGEPIIYISGSLYHLVDLETLLLQKLGAACVAAYNAYTMCADLPKVAFLAMDARHCAGTEMAEMMAYAAAVGSAAAHAARRAPVGFIGNATDATAHYFGRTRGMGTMPHALIGYAGSTVRAAEMFHETFPDDDLTVLVDYFGREVTDTLAVCRRFPELAAAGRLERAARHAWRALHRRARSRRVLRGAGAARARARSAAIAARRSCATWSAPAFPRPRSCRCARRWTRPGSARCKIVASSGFGPAKCRVMADAEAPIDVVGTGSYLPEKLERDLRHRRHRRV